MGLVPSRLLVNQLVERPHVNNWPPKPLVRVPHLLGELRNPIVTDLVLSLCVKFVVSRALLSEPYKKPLKLIWWACSKTLTCALFTPNVSLSCRKTSNLQDVFVASVLKH